LGFQLEAEKPEEFPPGYLDIYYILLKLYLKSIYNNNNNKQ
jgi:hypothetical protein